MIGTYSKIIWFILPGFGVSDRRTKQTLVIYLGAVCYILIVRSRTGIYIGRKGSTRPCAGVGTMVPVNGIGFVNKIIRVTFKIHFGSYQTKIQLPAVVVSFT